MRGKIMNKKEIENKIMEVLDTIRPYLNADGGNLEFIEYEDGYVYIKLLGLCAGCNFADETIQNGIFETLKQQIPEIKGVINSEFYATLDLLTYFFCLFLNKHRIAYVNSYLFFQHIFQLNFL